MSSTPDSRASRCVVLHVLAGPEDAVRLAPVFAGLQRSDAVRQVVVAADSDRTVDAWSELLAALCPRGALESGVRETFPRAELSTAASLLAAEAMLPALDPAVVVVGGASAVALGWALAAARLRLPVANVEAGLRDDDWGDAAEIDRVLLDTIADTLYVPTSEAVDNLVRQGVDASRVHHVGPTAIDAVRRLGRDAAALAAWAGLGLERGTYVLAMLDGLGDDDEGTARTTESLAMLARRLPVVLPLDDARRGRLDAMGDLHRLLEAGVQCPRPESYMGTLSLKCGAGGIVTDAGLVQDEATALGIECFTLRGSSERMITVTQGTNVLLGRDARELVDLAVPTRAPIPCAIPRWDGRSAQRIARSLVSLYALAPLRRAS